MQGNPDSFFRCAGVMRLHYLEGNDQKDNNKSPIDLSPGHLPAIRLNYYNQG